MNTTSLQKIVEDGIRFLSEIFSIKSYLYFPLLYASSVWAARRIDEWKENIFLWKVWIEPDIVNVKPDEFVLKFFKNNKSLNEAFFEKIQKNKSNIKRHP